MKSSVSIILVSMIVFTSAATRAQSACDAYVDCVCSIAEWLPNQQPSPFGECRDARALYADGGPAMLAVCEQMLEAMKESMAAMAPLLRAEGRSVPLACQ